MYNHVSDKRVWDKIVRERGIKLKANENNVYVTLPDGKQLLLDEYLKIERKIQNRFSCPS